MAVSGNHGNLGDFYAENYNAVPRLWPLQRRLDMYSHLIPELSQEAAHAMDRALGI
jgi:hypothetical protein